MTETLFKLLVVGAVVLAMYYAMSPYQNCLRAEEDQRLGNGKSLLHQKHGLVGLI